MSWSIVLVFLLAAAAPWATATAPVADRLHVTIVEGEDPVITLGSTGAETEDGPKSSCSVFVPFNTTCDGEDVPIGTVIRLELRYGLTSVSTGTVRWSEVVDGIAVFTYSCKVPYGVWLTANAGLVECEATGEPEWETTAHLHLFAQFLPSAGQHAAGTWSGTLYS